MVLRVHHAETSVSMIEQFSFHIRIFEELPTVVLYCTSTVHKISNNDSGLKIKWRSIDPAQKSLSQLFAMRHTRLGDNVSFDK